jgi:hypothetical protein
VLKYNILEIVSVSTFMQKLDTMKLISAVVINPINELILKLMIILFH